MMESPRCIRINRKWFLLLFALTACRLRVQLADCQTMLRWGIEIGHHGELSSGCALVDNDSVTDLSAEIMTPRELDKSIVHDNKNNNTKTTSIPKLLHQSYKSTMVPNSIIPFVRSWHSGLPHDWQFVWWTDDDLEWLVQTHYSKYAQVFERMPHTIMKVDTARYFILHHFGGVYADMDIEYSPKNQENATVTAALDRNSPLSN